MLLLGSYIPECWKFAHSCIERRDSNCIAARCSLDYAKAKKYHNRKIAIAFRSEMPLNRGWNDNGAA